MKRRSGSESALTSFGDLHPRFDLCRSERQTQDLGIVILNQRQRVFDDGVLRHGNVSYVGRSVKAKLFFFRVGIGQQ